MTYIEEREIRMRIAEELAKMMADGAGHGMREKCLKPAEIAATYMQELIDENLRLREALDSMVIVYRREHGIDGAYDDCLLRAEAALKENTND